MRVNVFDVAEDGTETVTAENVILSDCFPGIENDDEYHTAHLNLDKCGRYWCGGGAAPLRVIRRIGTAR